MQEKNGTSSKLADQTTSMISFLTFYWCCQAGIPATKARVSPCFYGLFRSNSSCGHTLRIVLLTAVCDCYNNYLKHRKGFIFLPSIIFDWFMCLVMMLFQLPVGSKIDAKCYCEAFLYLTYKHFYCSNIILWAELEGKTKKTCHFLTSFQ